MRALGLVAMVALCGCDPAWAQPRPRPRRVRDAGVAVVDAGVVRPATHGRIEPAAVQRVIATQRDAVRRCYTQAIARDATLHGEITVRLRVEVDGAVSETSTGGESTLRAVGRCIELVLRPLRFPTPTGGPATVAVPFVFAAEE